MVELMELVRTGIETIILALGYPGIVLVMFAENLFPPIPSELVMPFAGFLAARGELSFGGVLAAGTTGAVLGALALYGFGLWAGEGMLRALVQRWGRGWFMSVDDLDRALQIFERYGYPAVLVGRVMPILRSLISIPAGMRRMNLRWFLLLTCAGTGAWNALMGGAGLFLGARWDEILIFTKQYEIGVLIVLGGLVAAGLTIRLSREWRGRRRLGDMADEA